LIFQFYIDWFVLSYIVGIVFFHILGFVSSYIFGTVLFHIVGIVFWLVFFYIFWVVFWISGSFTIIVFWSSLLLP
jgi:hypothetical protein